MPLLPVLGKQRALPEISGEKAREALRPPGFTGHGNTNPLRGKRDANRPLEEQVTLNAEEPFLPTHQGVR